MPFEQEFVDQLLVASIPVFAETKSQIVEYYQNAYGSRWRQPLVHDLAPIAGLKEKNLQRRFDPSRINNQPRRSAEQEQYRALGRNIGAIDYQVPSSGYEVTFIGQIAISRKCYARSFIKHITGADAQSMLDEAGNGQADYMTMFNAYFDGEDVAEGFCGDPEIIIAPWEAGDVEGRPKQAHQSRTAYAKR